MLFLKIMIINVTAFFIVQLFLFTTFIISIIIMFGSLNMLVELIVFLE